MDQALKLRHTFDALFGNGISRNLPKDIKMTFSKKTGRIKTASHQDRLLCTLRIDGGLAITTYCAEFLLRSRKFRENCVEVDGDAAPFVERGRSVFCKHVLWCGRNVRVSDDVPVLFQDTVIAVGKAVLSAEMMYGSKRGVAVRIRNSLKSSNGESRV